MPTIPPTNTPDIKLDLDELPSLVSDGTKTSADAKAAVVSVQKPKPEPNFSSKSLDAIFEYVGQDESQLSQQPEHEYRRLMQSSSTEGMRKVNSIIRKDGVDNSKADDSKADDSKPEQDAAVIDVDKDTALQAAKAKVTAKKRIVVCSVGEEPT